MPLYGLVRLAAASVDVEVAGWPAVPGAVVAEAGCPEPVWA
jgi:hypothetical protein